MKSLYAARRPSRMMLLITSIVVIALALSLILSLQNRREAVGNVSQFLMTDPIVKKPSVASSTIEQPVATLQAPPTQITDENAGIAVKQTAAAQSTTVGSAVEYPTLQITTAQRDRLLVVALSISMIGFSLYAMTLLAIAPRAVPVTRRPFYKVIDT